MENIISEINKEETPKNVQAPLIGDKNKPIHPPIKRNETSGKQTDSPASKKDETNGNQTDSTAKNKIPAAVQQPL